MKYIGFWKVVSGDVMDVIGKFRKITVEWEKENEKNAKLIFGPFQFSGESKGFTLFETDNPETLTNIANFYSPEIKWKFFSINNPTEAADFLHDITEITPNSLPFFQNNIPNCVCF